MNISDFDFLRYPDPPKRDESLTSMAAMILTKREGVPKESWMNYWRCDADFNHHHRLLQD